MDMRRALGLRVLGLLRTFSSSSEGVDKTIAAQLRQGLAQLREGAEKRGPYLRRKLEREPPPSGEFGGTRRKKHIIMKECMYIDAFKAIIWEEKSMRRHSPVLVPGFPLDIVDIVSSKDASHLTVFWGIGSESMPTSTKMEAALARLSHTALDRAEALILAEMQSRLERSTGYLRARLVSRVPGKRAPTLSFRHFSHLDPTTKATYKQLGKPP